MENKESESYPSPLYSTLFNCYMNETKQKAHDFIFKKNFFDANCYLFQEISNPQKIIDMIFNLTYFYDQNFIGNKDFIRIPNIHQITQNIKKYPIMLITRKDEYGIEEILGATTIKVEENYSIQGPPFFPAENETVLSITGVLSKKDILDCNGARIRGIGKELYKSSIKGAYKINSAKRVRLIIEIDCRNIMSLNSIAKAVKELNEENINVQSFITGYYSMYDKYQSIVEPPSFVIEIDLNGDKQLNNTITEFSYANCGPVSLLADLEDVLRKNTKQRNAYFNIYNENIVKYQNIEPLNTLNVKLEVGTSADGNDRASTLKALEPQYVF